MSEEITELDRQNRDLEVLRELYSQLVVLFLAALELVPRHVGQRRRHGAVITEGAAQIADLPRERVIVGDIAARRGGGVEGEEPTHLLADGVPLAVVGHQALDVGGHALGHCHGLGLHLPDETLGVAAFELPTGTRCSLDA
jgi:hypothetical protein